MHTAQFFTKYVLYCLVILPFLLVFSFYGTKEELYNR